MKLLRKESMKEKENVSVDINKELIKILERDLNIEKEQANITNSQSNYNIVTITVLSSVLAAITFELLDRIPKLNLIIIIFSLILALTLILSLLFATLSHFIYKQVYPAHPDDLVKNINRQLDFYKDNGFIEQDKNDLYAMYVSTLKNNRKRKIFLRLSFAGIWAFLALFIIFAIVIMILV